MQTYLNQEMHTFSNKYLDVSVKTWLGVRVLFNPLQPSIAFL